MINESYDPDVREDMESWCNVVAAEMSLIMFTH